MLVAPYQRKRSIDNNIWFKRTHIKMHIEMSSLCALTDNEDDNNFGIMYHAWI